MEQGSSDLHVQSSDPADRLRRKGRCRLCDRRPMGKTPRWVNVITAAVGIGGLAVALAGLVWAVVGRFLPPVSPSGSTPTTGAAIINGHNNIGIGVNNGQV